MTLAPPDTTRDAEVSAAAVFGGFVALALANAVVVLVAVPLPSEGPLLRAVDLAFALAETVGLGSLGALIVFGVIRFVRVPRWVLLALAFFAAVVLVQLVMGDYLVLSAAHARDGKFETLALANSFMLSASALVMAPFAGFAFTQRPRLRFAPPVLALGIFVVNQSLLRDDYFGIHGLMVLTAVLLAGPSLAPLVLALAKRLQERGGPFALPLLLSLCLLPLLLPPPNRVRHELFRQPTAIAPWVLATVVWRPPSLHAPVTLPPSPWNTDRAKDPPVSPTSPTPLPSNPVVVLITIDALRADAVNPATNDAAFPMLASLKARGVTFTHATTPGTQTPVSLSAMFSGHYFSELRWEHYGTGGDRYPYPANDPVKRFPALLTQHGVSTAQEEAYVFLANRFGVARGFREESAHGKTTAAAGASVLTSGLITRLEHVKDEPLFLYAHFGEPHAPYLFGPPSDDFHHYLAAIAAADREVARIEHYLEQHLGDRWVLIVSSDHGEAFGDHQTYEHAKTLYDELVHVPLLVRSPVIAPRKIDDRVGLIDLGPTILDLFQVPTPATLHGESLVPLLLGRRATLTRPLLAEARLETSLTLPDGLKVIEDTRRKTVEVYDLATDPGETRNIFDSEPARSDWALASMRAFFAARTLTEKGYEPPYKP